MWWARGAPKLPNQLLTSPETVKYIEEAHERPEKKEKVKKEKDEFVKKKERKKHCLKKLKKKEKLKKKPNKTRNDFEHLKCSTMWLNIGYHIWQF